jgi:LuxR family maltose regulon positive regulatory protein
LLCLVDQTWLLIERRRVEDAIETISRAEALAAAMHASPALTSRITSTAARLYLLTGQLDEARRATTRTPVGPRRSLVDARVALATDRPADAEGYLADIEIDAWPRHELEAALIRARVALATDRSAAAVEAEVERALSIALEHGLSRTVALETDLSPVIDHVLRHSAPGSRQDLLRRYIRARPAVPLLSTSNDGRGSAVPSARELEILRYLATLMSYREIAAELFISRNTMKTHVRSLYRRLGVSSRSQAVLEGRARGLL